MFLPPILLRSTCLAFWCAGQCNIRCWMVSGSWRQAGQIGESTIWIQFRCLARGAWPVLNCDSILALRLGRLAMSLIYVFEGDVGSVFFILSYRGDCCHNFCVLRFNFSKYAALVAELLWGNGFLSCTGSACALLLPSVIAFLACSSARSWASLAQPPRCLTQKHYLLNTKVTWSLRTDACS